MEADEFDFFDRGHGHQSRVTGSAFIVRAPSAKSSFLGYSNDDFTHVAPASKVLERFWSLVKVKGLVDQLR